MFLETFAKYAFAGRIPRKPKTLAPLTGLQRILRSVATRAEPITPGFWSTVESTAIALAKKLSKPPRLRGRPQPKSWPQPWNIRKLYR